MPPSQPFKNSPSLDSLTLLSISSPSSASISSTLPTSSPSSNPHRRSRTISPAPLHLSRTGEPLWSTGHASVGSEVPVDLLQSVILAPSVQEGKEEVRESSKDWLKQRSQSYKREKTTDEAPPASGTTTAQPPLRLPTFLTDDDSASNAASTSKHPVLLSPAALPKTPLQQHTFDAPPPLHPRPPTHSHSRDSTLTAEVPASWTRTIAYTPALSFPPVRYLSGQERKRVLVTGGAGFVGSHLVDRLMFMGHDVTVLDNFFTGHKTALSHWIGHPNFELIRHDVVDPFMIECDQIYHLACPASPIAYQYNAIKTLKTNFSGTMNMLGLAKRVKARFLLSSTSEVYGSPEQHPQKESYWGHVNPIGPRACYDEGKRVAEALAYGYARENNVDVRVARIFNTFGPRMSSTDGRVVSNFITRALRGQPLEIYGDGSQTRSLMYIHDLIDGLILLMNVDGSVLLDPTTSTDQVPVNLGSQDEASILSWAEHIVSVAEEVKREQGIKTPKSEIVYKEALPDDPPKRRPDTSRAGEVLGWRMRWTVRAGLYETARFFAAAEEGELRKLSAGVE